MGQRRACYRLDLWSRGRQRRAAPQRRASVSRFLLPREGQEVIAAAGYYVPRTDVASPILKDAASKTKVIPLPMTLAPRYNEYYQTYRKVMGLK